MDQGSTSEIKRALGYVLKDFGLGVEGVYFSGDKIYSFSKGVYDSTNGLKPLQHHVK